jgi:hypothetical protein
MALTCAATGRQTECVCLGPKWDVLASFCEFGGELQLEHAFQHLGSHVTRTSARSLEQFQRCYIIHGILFNELPLAEGSGVEPRALGCGSKTFIQF